MRGKDGQRNQDHRAAPGGHIGPGWAGHNPNHVVPGAGMHSYRGGRGNFNHRGGRGNNNNNVGAFQHRNFPGPMVAAPAVNFQGAPMTAYPGGMVGGVNPYGYPNRGAMMGAMRTGPMAGRGGRGGMAPNGMMGGMANMGAGPGMMGGMAGPMGGVAPPMAMAHIGPQGMPAPLWTGDAVADGFVRHPSSYIYELFHPSPSDVAPSGFTITVTIESFPPPPPFPLPLESHPAAFPTTSLGSSTISSSHRHSQTV